MPSTVATLFGAGAASAGARPESRQWTTMAQEKFVSRNGLINTSGVKGNLIRVMNKDLGAGAAGSSFFFHACVRLGHRIPFFERAQAWPASFPLTPALSPEERVIRIPILDQTERHSEGTVVGRFSLSPGERAGVRGRRVGCRPATPSRPTFLLVRRAFRCPLSFRVR